MLHRSKLGVISGNRCVARNSCWYAWHTEHKNKPWANACKA